MGSLLNPSELTLDLKPSFIPKTISQFLGGMSRIGSVTEKVLQVDDFVDRLQSETRKIEAFKRELPLCMLLINDAIVALKDVSMVLKKSSNVKPVLEEFIPLKNSCDDNDDDGDSKDESIIKKDNGDKKNWLSSTQLWNTNENNNIIQKANATIKKRTEEEDYGKALFFAEIKNPIRENGLVNEISGDSRLTLNVQSNIQTGGGIATLPPHHQTSRKQRRCWSTELHRRFVNALHQLGGSQAATPKQIRELMQVDGLTNDEVKSHLQKYRLHTRRLPSSNTNQSGVVLGGGLWMPPQDQYVGSSKYSNSQSGSPDGPLSNGGNTMDDEEDEKSENYCWNGNL